MASLKLEQSGATSMSSLLEPRSPGRAISRTFAVSRTARKPRSNPI